MKKKSGISFLVQFLSSNNKKTLNIKESLSKASKCIQMFKLMYPNVSKVMIFRIENTYFIHYNYSQNSHILCTLVRAKWCAKGQLISE